MKTQRLRSGPGSESIAADYQLQDRLNAWKGRVFLSGTHALVRLLLSQAEMDRTQGRRSGGFVSGYRGSPLARLDTELWRAHEKLGAAGVVFHPAINEEMAATAILGTQQVESDPAATVEGVFAMWYGKGLGLDRAGDALAQANGFGTSRNGGVLVVSGEDHTCTSSPMPFQGDLRMMAWRMPVLHPVSVADYVSTGLYGIALSRYSGLYVGFKAVTEVVESTVSVELAEWPRFVEPADYVPPATGLHYRWPDMPGAAIEPRLIEKIRAAGAFARSNPIDRLAIGDAKARLVIVAVGKAFADVAELLRRAGVDAECARQIGLSVYRMVQVYPVEVHQLSSVVAAAEEILVVEEKRSVVELQLKDELAAAMPGRPTRITGKKDPAGRPLIEEAGVLTPSSIAAAIARRMEAIGLSLSDRIAAQSDRRSETANFRVQGRPPYFCSGCPHNISTGVPEGSRASAGIGCHFMANWMDRNTEGLLQMGGEGANWIGRAPFTGKPHVFQNLGEGTYYHSGSLAIRQAVAARLNLTYKILFNEAVAMTGGQPVDGPISVASIAAQVRAEGVQRIAVVTDEPKKYQRGINLPSGATVNDRGEMNIVQQELRTHPGVSVLIYDQACAAEKRRRRKHGRYADPPRRVVINDRVCEGCGDCSVQSNCVSIIPRKTDLGVKRAIDQSSCNKDFSCLNGFCPSFVTIEGGRLRQGDANEVRRLLADVGSWPSPSIPTHLAEPFEIVVAGVGGTGVLTIGAMVAMAAHLEAKGATTLDFSGLAQKGGSVFSHVRVGASPRMLHQLRIDAGCANAVIACDLVVATTADVLQTCKPGCTRIVVNAEPTPTIEFVLHGESDIEVDQRMLALQSAAGTAQSVVSIEATKLAKRYLGDAVFANAVMLGVAWQMGLIPVGLEALQRAIDLNGIQVDANIQAFNLGRLAAFDPQALCSRPELEPVHLDGEMTGAVRDANAVIAQCEEHLTLYQDAAYAARFREVIDRVRTAEETMSYHLSALTRAAAEGLFHVMAYKDEYEVARLFVDGRFDRQIRDEFEGDYRIVFHMAPPVLSGKRDGLGRPTKRAFGPWLKPILRVFARSRRIRGTWLDPFRFSADRQAERTLRREYGDLVEAVIPKLTPDNYHSAVALLSAVREVRGFGPVKARAIANYKERIAQKWIEFTGLQEVVRSPDSAVGHAEPRAWVD